jgi:hypothetical protein
MRAAAEVEGPRMSREPRWYNRFLRSRNSLDLFIVDWLGGTKTVRSQAGHEYSRN